MTTSIARVTVSAHDGGWTARCRCQWSIWHIARHVADLEAVKHQGACGRARPGRS